MGYGGVVGPPLDKIGGILNRTELMESLVNPSKRLAPGYGTYILSLKEGEKVSGILAKETQDSLYIQVASGEKRVLPHTAIAARELGPSAMPSMQHILALQELRDLIEFLTSLN